MMRFGERNSSTVMKCEHSSEISNSSESIIETNNNISTSKDNWKVVNKHPENGLMRLNKKAFTVLCEPEADHNENREQNQTPTSR
jgi:hypothetical protein